MYNDREVSVKMKKTMGILTTEMIKRIHSEAFIPQLGRFEYAGWFSDYIETVTFAASRRDKLDSIDVQHFLWETNTIGGVGLCKVKLGPAIENSEFRNTVASLLAMRIPEDFGAAVLMMEAIYTGLQAACRKHISLIPWVRLLRVLAAVYPQQITCVTTIPKLQMLAKGTLPDIPTGAMGSPIELNLRILDHLNSVLGGIPSSSIPETVKRSMFAWYLYTEVNRRNVLLDSEPIEEVH